MLKAWVAALVIVSSTAVTAFAGGVREGIDVILLGGTSSAYFRGSDNVLLGEGTRKGGTAGLAFVMVVNPTIGLEMDIRYTQKGGEGNVDVSDYDKPTTGPSYVGNGTTELNYIEVPLLVAAHMATGRNSFARAYSGPSFNFLASANFDGEIEGQPQKVDIKDNISSMDFDLVIGGGWTYETHTASIWFDGRWVLGLVSIDNNSDRQIINYAWEFALGVGIPLKR
jgi:hypothetical protein